MLNKLGLVMVVVSDMDRSVAFYRDVLGLKLKYQTPGWSELDMDGVELGLHISSPTLEVNPKAGVQIGFYVDDIAQELADLRSRGATVLHESDEQFGKLAVVADPDGYGVQLCQLKQ